MRIVLVTGKGGVGKTTVAAATALAAAEQGERTVVCSTDPAHSLADALRVELGDTPTEVSTRVRAVQLDARARFEEAWEGVRGFVSAWLDWAGADPIEAEELAVIPGLEEVFALAEVKALAQDPAHDLVVVDCAPTAETLRLLSLPDVLGWYMQRVFPAQRGLTRTVRPFLSRVMSMPIAGDRVFDAVSRFYERLDGVRELLTDGDVTSARLVVTPERMVVAEARRLYTYLGLFGYHVDAVVVNRVLPDGIRDPWFDAWHAAQGEHLDEIDTAFSPLPLLTGALAPVGPSGADELRAFGLDLYDGLAPSARLSPSEPLRVHADGDALVLSLALPFARHDDVELGRRNGELLLAVGPHRRAVALPDSLRRREVGGARLADGRLEVEFVEA